MILIVLTHYVGATVLSDVYLNLVLLLVTDCSNTRFFSFSLNLIFETSTFNLSLISHRGLV